MLLFAKVKLVRTISSPIFIVKKTSQKKHALAAAPPGGKNQLPAPPTREFMSPASTSACCVLTVPAGLVLFALAKIDFWYKD